MTFFIIIFWLILCFVVGSLGSNKNIGSTAAFLIALFLSPLIGFIVVLASTDKKKVSVKWKVEYELAKKAEFKGQTEVAIDKYMDTIYHLTYDYKNLSSTQDKKRQNKISEIKRKVEELKSNR